MEEMYKEAMFQIRARAPTNHVVQNPGSNIIKF